MIRVRAPATTEAPGASSNGALISLSAAPLSWDAWDSRAEAEGVSPAVAEADEPDRGPCEDGSESAAERCVPKWTAATTATTTATAATAVVSSQTGLRRRPGSAGAVGTPGTAGTVSNLIVAGGGWGTPGGPGGGGGVAVRGGGRRAGSRRC